MPGQCLLLQLSHHKIFKHEWVNKEAVQLGSATQVEAIYHLKEIFSLNFSLGKWCAEQTEYGFAE